MPDFTLNHPRGSAKGGFGGLVPVQGFGSVTRDGVDQCWYFRARHDAWMLSVGAEHATIEEYVGETDIIWYAVGTWGHWPDAGYMPDATVTAILRDALTRYLDGAENWDAPPDLYMGVSDG